jgi:hypothetical protein
MKLTFLLVALLSAGGLLTARPGLAQCRPVYVPTYSHCHHRDTGRVEKPLVPGRWAVYAGVLGLRDRRGTPYAGGDLEGAYWLRPRWSTGLRGTFTGRMPTAAAAESYSPASQPRLQLYSIAWTHSLVLADKPTWRLALQAGAGLGGVALYDQARQVPVRGGCGCTQAEKMASATAPVTEVGLAATYKLKGNDAPWLTLRGGYRQWNGTVPFGALNQFSTYVLSVGMSLPDAPRARK